jgi:hypothetical protein
MKIKDNEKIIYDKLKGKYKHFCPDWDFLAIDETHGEFECCSCNKEEILNVKDGKK